MIRLYFHLGEAIPNLTDIIQAICAVIVMICAIVGLFSWIMQDRNNAVSSMFAKLGQTYRLVRKLKSQSYRLLSEEENIKIENQYATFANEVKHHYNLKKRFEYHLEDIDSIEELTSLAMAKLSDTNPMKKFFIFVVDHIEEMKTANLDYGFTATGIENERITRNDLKFELDTLSTYTEQTFAGSQWAYKYLTLAEANTTIQEEFDISNKRYQAMLQTMRDKKLVLFNDMFNKPTEYEVSLKTLYDSALEYRNNFSKIGNQIRLLLSKL